MIIGLLTLFSQTAYAGDVGGFSAPYILMTPTEIQHLPNNDRLAYLGTIRALISDSDTDESLLLSSENSCGETRKQCEPSLFGAHVCIAKHASAKTACVTEMNKGKSYAENSWGSYYVRIQNYCRESHMPKFCKDLQKKRISVFLSRRTH